MAETAADIVARMAAEHGVAVDPSTRAYRLAKGSSRLAGIEGDETLDLLAELSRRGLVDRRQAVDLIERHAKETGGDADAMQKRHIGKAKGGWVELLLSCPAEPEDLPDRRRSGACMFDPRAVDFGEEPAALFRRRAEALEGLAVIDDAIRETCGWTPRHSSVVSDPRTLGGEPCISGTRIPAMNIVAELRAGTPRSEIFRGYPSLPADAVVAVLRWAEENGIDVKGEG